MNRGMFDMMMRDMVRGRSSRGGRDSRNPYGSRGGYITNRDPRRHDRAYEEDFARRRKDYREDYNYDEEDYNRGYENDYARGGRGGRRSQSDGHGGYYPFELMGRVGYEEMFDPRYQEDMMYDYARGRRDYGYPMYDGAEEGMLTDRELEQWARKLLEEVEEKDKPFFKFENIKKKSEEMGIKFDKFSPMELYVATLAMYTDYGKTLGTANMDLFIRMGKDFLCDPDAGLKYGMKLAAYYDSIVEG